MPDSAPPPAAAQHADLAARRRAVIAFVGLLLAVVPAVLDIQIAATALPTVLAELGGIEQVAWIGSGYLLASSLAIPLAGKLGDLYGRRAVFAAATALFLAGSLACGLARSMTFLVAARIVQGLGGGAVIVTMFAALADLFGPRERARFQGYAAGLFALASAIGPTLGGAITDQFGWRAAFLINLPLALAAPFLVAAGLAPRRADAPPRIDWLGAAFLGAGMTALVVLADRAATGAAGWTTPALAFVAVVALAAWVRASLRAAEPVVPLRLLADPVIASAAAISFCGGWVGMGAIQYFALFAQGVLGASATTCGVVLLGLTVGVTATSMATGLVVARTGRYRWVPMASMVASSLAMALLATMGPATAIATIAAYLALLGFGIGLTVQIVVLAAQNAAPARDVGAATAMVTLARSIGATLGVAFFGLVLNAMLAGTEASVAPIAYARALTAVFASALPVLLLGFVAAFAFRPRPLAARQ
jgi:EmrB/QacA subfamily drug resistance transporter